MKKIIICLTTAFLSCAFMPAELKAGAFPAKTEIPARQGETPVPPDHSTLSSSDRDAREKNNGAPVKAQGDGHGGIYISVGAIIIIILLLIILL